MNRLVAFGLTACLWVGCTSWITVDGYDAVYAEPPAANIETYPHYTYEGGEVYVVNERYYHRGSDGRWVQFRERPRTAAAARPQERREEPRTAAAPPVAM